MKTYCLKLQLWVFFYMQTANENDIFCGKKKFSTLLQIISKKIHFEYFMSLKLLTFDCFCYFDKSIKADNNIVEKSFLICGKKNCRMNFF